MRAKASPEFIARGMALGTLVAFTPIIGFHFVLAIALAYLFRGSRAAAIIPIWITNPLTLVPIFTTTHRLGRLFWHAPVSDRINAHLQTVVDQMTAHSVSKFAEGLREFAVVGFDNLVCMWIGGLLAGGVAASVVYPLTVRGVLRYRAIREQRREKKRVRAKSSGPGLV
jgi:hypothetical protein